MSDAKPFPNVSPIFLDRKQVETMLGISRSTIYRLMSEDKFPKPIRIRTSVRWRVGDIVAWAESQRPET